MLHNGARDSTLGFRVAGLRFRVGILRLRTPPLQPGNWGFGVLGFWGFGV